MGAPANTTSQLLTALAPAVKSLTDAFFPAYVSFQSRTEVQRPSGSTQYTWVDDSSLAHIRAVIETAQQYLERTRQAAAIGVGSSMGLPVRSGDYIVTLDGYYPTIDSTMKMVDQDGIDYTVDGIDADPMHLFTKVYCHRTSPEAN